MQDISTPNGRTTPSSPRVPIFATTPQSSTNRAQNTLVIIKLSFPSSKPKTPTSIFLFSILNSKIECQTLSQSSNLEFRAFHHRSSNSNNRNYRSSNLSILLLGLLSSNPQVHYNVIVGVGTCYSCLDSILLHLIPFIYNLFVGTQGSTDMKDFEFCVCLGKQRFMFLCL